MKWVVGSAEFCLLRAKALNFSRSFQLVLFSFCLQIAVVIECEVSRLYTCAGAT